MEKEFKEGEQKVETRRKYRYKKKLEELKRKVKKAAILIFIGFILGIIYSNKLIYADKEHLAYASVEETKEVVKEETKEPVKEVVEETAEFCYLDEVSCKIKKVADRYEIDWMVAVAIAKHETGNFTSNAFTNLNNVGGMMYWNGSKSVLKSFNSLDEGIEAYVYNLKTYYYDMGLDTIEAIQKKYAPIGAANDPQNLNSNWVSGVYRYYNTLSK